MTAPWMILSLLMPALVGWLISLAVLNFLKKGGWLSAIDLSAIGSGFQREILSPEFVSQKLLSPENYQKLVPQIETHIDHFLRVRLKEDMPVVGMMIGDRTISQMKTIFLKELEQLFPQVMEGYLNNISSDGEFSEMLSEKLGNSLSPNLLQPVLKKINIRVQVLGMGAGFATGILQILIYFLSGA